MTDVEGARARTCGRCHAPMPYDEAWASESMGPVCDRCAQLLDPYVCSCCRGWGIVEGGVCEECGGEG